MHPEEAYYEWERRMNGVQGREGDAERSHVIVGYPVFLLRLWSSRCAVSLRFHLRILYSLLPPRSGSFPCCGFDHFYYAAAGNRKHLPYGVHPSGSARFFRPDIVSLYRSSDSKVSRSQTYSVRNYPRSTASWISVIEEERRNRLLYHPSGDSRTSDASLIQYK